MEKTHKLSDYLYILYKWRKFIIVNLLIIGSIATIAVFLVPNQYKSTATILIPPDSEMGLGGLTNLLGGKSSIASMGSKIFGSSNTSEDILLGILNSRTALTKIIKTFNLMSYYEIGDNNIDKAIKAFKEDLSADPNEFGMIEFSVINKNPNKSAKIANYLIALVDSVNIQLNMERAKNNRIYIEKRYNKNVSDLKRAEDSLYSFQRKYGIVAVPEQLEVTVKAAAEVEAQLTKKEMESFFTKQMYGENSPQYMGVSAEIKMLKDKIQELKSSSRLGTSSNILFPFKEMPDIAIQYLRNFREVEIQQTIMEFVLPMYEQAKVEEQKSMPTIMIIDKAVPPQLKYAPKRATIVLGILFLSLFFLTPLVFSGEHAISNENSTNPLQLKSKKLFAIIVKIYRLKF